jgi:WD40 repeat protein
MNVVLGDDPRYLGRIFPSAPTLSGYDVSPDGTYLTLRTTTGLIELYDAGTRTLVTSIQAEATGPAAKIAFLPDGTSALVVSFDAAKHTATFVLRDVPSLAELKRFELSTARDDDMPETFGSAPGLAPDGRHNLALVNGVLHVLDVDDWTTRTVSELPLLGGGIAFDPLGRYIAGSPSIPGVTFANSTTLFDAGTYAPVRTISPGDGTSSSGGNQFTPDGNLLVPYFGVGQDPGRVELWDPETGELLASTPSQQVPGLLAIDSTGSRVAFATASRQLGVLSLPGLEPTTLPIETLTIVFPVPRFSPDDRTIYNLALTYALEHWDLSGSGLASTYTEAAGPGNVGLAPDGSWFIKQSPDGHWSRWALPQMTLIDRSTTTAGDVPLPAIRPLGPAVSADGKFFATGHSDCPRTSQAPCAASVVVWDALTGRQLGEPILMPTIGLRNQMYLEFHPDLPLLAIGATRNLVTIVSLEDGTPRMRNSFTIDNRSNDIITSMDFLPSSVAPSPTLIANGGTLISVWEVGGETAVRLGTTWDGKATVRGMVVAPDGMVVLVRTTGDLQFVDYESLTAGTEPVPGSTIPAVLAPGLGGTLHFSADGRSLAVTSVAEGKVRVWDLEKKVLIGSSFAWLAATNAFLTPDGKGLLVASDQATVLWDLDTALWAEKVCLAAGRNLTEEEWAKYFPGRNYEVTCERWPAKPEI